MRQCHEMATLLKRLRSYANTEDHVRIGQILKDLEGEMPVSSHPTAPFEHATSANGTKETPKSGPLNNCNELDQGPMDPFDEDLNANNRARATSFVGRSSVVQWLREVATAHSERTRRSPGQHPEQCSSALDNEATSLYSFWTDGDNLEDEPYVDSYKLPSLEIAEGLLDCYMSKVHDSFPILIRATFEEQFRSYFTASQNDGSPYISRGWRAIVNLVFAIGAYYSYLAKPDWRTNERDHILYQARDRALHLEKATLTCDVDITQVKGLGLLAFYWMSVGQISRAWTIVGTALRFAYRLGLHVDNNDTTIPEAEQEIMRRTWWSLYSLEQNLCATTGRPSIIVESFCSVPLPVPVTEKQAIATGYRMCDDSASLVFRTQDRPPNISKLALESVASNTTNTNPGSFFTATVQLYMIIQDILTSLYSANSLVRAAQETQQTMVDLGQRLDQWALSLPKEFNFHELTTENIEFNRERVLIGFQACSARMMLTRPCLGAQGEVWKEGVEASFARRMGDGCIEAAIMIVDFLPDQPSSGFMYGQGPWWCVVHYLMQAVSIFWLGLSYPYVKPHDGMTLVRYTKKVGRCLQAMHDPMAQRAFRVVKNLVESLPSQWSSGVPDPWRGGSPHAEQTQKDHSNDWKPARRPLSIQGLIQ
ncbi:fungal-specific transcription factor domain-containing protein [Boeremia exigua]|uniref:fungal-specific transcription factor domain-containing protein n=1 Tax=Boeremia exigua TaxID=749465 RepID=UPI001E8CE356|nr:fungal-specific transcription factor domain-containing protein [Boeremia exigua]KAH6612982.1 fungal-specific transcription factor domain-containing protein [Boeremia exigua]